MAGGREYASGLCFIAHRCSGSSFLNAIAAAITCPAVTVPENNATFPKTNAGSINVAGTCVTGYSGAPTRTCGNTATFPGTWTTGSNNVACTRTREGARGKDARATLLTSVSCRLCARVDRNSSQLPCGR